MSNDLVKLLGSDALESLDKDVLEKYQNLHNKIAGQASTFDECASEWRPSRLYLTQPTTGDESGKPESAQMGDYFYKGGIIPRPLRFVVAYIHPTRVRFVPDVDRQPSCRSENVDLRNYGAKDTSVSIYGDKCAECPYDDQPFRHGKPTNCNTAMNILLIPESLEDIFTLPLSKSAWSVGRRIVDQTAVLPKPWGRFFSLDSKEQKRTNGAGKYAVPVVQLLDNTEENRVPDHLQAFAEFIYSHYREYRKSVRSSVKERVSDVEEAIDVDTLDKDSPDFSDSM